MKDAIVAGVFAGIVGGSIVAGAIGLTKTGLDDAQSGPIEVYGQVEVMNGYSGFADPVLFKIDQPIGYQAPDGSRENPYYIVADRPIVVELCENIVWKAFCNPQ